MRRTIRNTGVWNSSELLAPSTATTPTPILFACTSAGQLLGGRLQRYDLSRGLADSVTAQPTNTTFWIDAIDFSDATHGWAVAINQILSTTNGGTTWSTSSQTFPYLNSIDAVDAATVGRWA